MAQMITCNVIWHHLSMMQHATEKLDQMQLQSAISWLKVRAHSETFIFLFGLADVPRKQRL